MPIDLNEYFNIKEKKEKSDRELLKFFKPDTMYTTNQIQEFLGVNNAATLGRLKKLKRGGFLELKIIKRIYHWYKVKEMDEKQIITGWLFG
jgi:DNA-binding Lrp family transcriptional regulator